MYKRKKKSTNASVSAETTGERRLPSAKCEAVVKPGARGDETSRPSAFSGDAERCNVFTNHNNKKKPQLFHFHFRQNSNAPQLSHSHNTLHLNFHTIYETQMYKIETKPHQQRRTHMQKTKIATNKKKPTTNHKHENTTKKPFFEIIDSKNIILHLRHLSSPLGKWYYQSRGRRYRRFSVFSRQ